MLHSRECCDRASDSRINGKMTATTIDGHPPKGDSLTPPGAMRLLALAMPDSSTAGDSPSSDAEPGTGGALGGLAGLTCLGALYWGLLFAGPSRLWAAPEALPKSGSAGPNEMPVSGSVTGAALAASDVPLTKEPHVRHTTAAILAMTLASSAALAQAGPDGHLLIADSAAEFSTVQGQGGWRYRYDRGPGTSVFDMANFIPTNGWCATPQYGGAGNSLDQSYAFLGIELGHTNTSSPCNTPGQGVLRPIRQWSPNTSGPLKILIEVSVASTSVNGVRFDLKIGDALAWTRTVTASTQGPVAALIDSPQSALIQLVTDGLGNCHGDMFQSRIRIYAPDCDGNQVVDATQIALSPGLDANGNQRLDCCEGTYTCCQTDLFANRQTDGADLAILLSQWGPNTGSTVCDFNMSGSVDGSDLATLLAAWGPCPQ